MTTPPIDPEFRGAARFLPRNAAHPRLLRLIGAFGSAITRLRNDPLVSLESVGSTTVRVHCPQDGDGRRSPAILWLHGGGFIGGSPTQDDDSCRRLADELGAVVVAPRYPLSPAHPFPAALEVAHEVLVWLARRDDVDPDRIALAGASAGGGLAAQLALLARERGEVRPVMQALVYPMLDDRTALRTDIDESNFRLWNNRGNHLGWTAYLGREPGGPDVSPIAAPSRNPDLSGLPPTWIGVGNLDLFHDEDVAYSEALRAAGVPCETLVIEGVFHGFDGIVPKASATIRLQRSMNEALRRSFGSATAAGGSNA